MNAKILEIRDEGTFIPMLAVRLGSDEEQERWLAAKAGYGLGRADQEKYIMLIQLNGGGGKAFCDPYDWGRNPRTYFVAHNYIIEHWDELEPGSVVCVEHILGERATPKTSDRLWHPPNVINAEELL